MSADIPATREEAEALARGYAAWGAGTPEERALLALARASIDWLYPTEEVRMHVASGLFDTMMGIGKLSARDQHVQDHYLRIADAAIAALTGGKP